MPKTHEEAENAAAEAARTAVGDGDYMQGWIDRMDMLLGVTPESAAADAAECATEEQREAAELAWLASTGTLRVLLLDVLLEGQAWMMKK